MFNLFCLLGLINVFRPQSKQKKVTRFLSEHSFWQKCYPNSVFHFIYYDLTPKCKVNRLDANNNKRLGDHKLYNKFTIYSINSKNKMQLRGSKLLNRYLHNSWPSACIILYYIIIIILYLYYIALYYMKFRIWIKKIDL